MNEQEFWNMKHAPYHYGSGGKYGLHKIPVSNNICNINYAQKRMEQEKNLALYRSTIASSFKNNSKNKKRKNYEIMKT